MGEFIKGGKFMKINWSAAWAAGAVFFPVSAHAYLDAGSASMVFQAIIAALVGAAVTAKIYWKRLSGWARRLFSGKPQE